MSIRVLRLGRPTALFSLCYSTAVDGWTGWSGVFVALISRVVGGVPSSFSSTSFASGVASASYDHGAASVGFSRSNPGTCGYTGRTALRATVSGSTTAPGAYKYGINYGSGSTSVGIWVTSAGTVQAWVNVSGTETVLGTTSGSGTITLEVQSDTLSNVTRYYAGGALFHTEAGTSVDMSTLGVTIEAGGETSGPLTTYSADVTATDVEVYV